MIIAKYAPERGKDLHWNLIKKKVGFFVVVVYFFFVLSVGFEIVQLKEKEKEIITVF